ncbi:MAG: hypothetical protein WCO23_02715 [bacterium]
MSETQPTYSELKTEIIAHRLDLKEIEAREHEKARRPWRIYDSTLLTDPEIGERKDFSFQACFASLLPKEVDGRPIENIRQYIEETLSSRNGQALGIEFGGPARQLFDGFTQGFFQKTEGVVLKDIKPRSDYEPNGGRQHKILEGDFFDIKIQREIGKWFDGEQVDLIFEKMEGGLDYLPYDFRLTMHQFSRMYAMLREGGLMFVQLPPPHHRVAGEYLGDIINDWVEGIHANYPDVLELVVHQNLLRLNKLPGAPDVLPKINLPRMQDTK